MKDQLENQLTINEAHRLKVAEDFDKWNKMKHYQQMADKYKSQLKTKEDECVKLQHTCNGYRILIERLEREKHGLQNRLKLLRNNCASINVARFEMLELENSKLQAEIETLKSKLEMQHHHSGGLGAAMLQEKLEAQERKIAILQLSAKVNIILSIVLQSTNVQNSSSPYSSIVGFIQITSCRNKNFLNLNVETPRPVY